MSLSRRKTHLDRYRYTRKEPLKLCSNTPVLAYPNYLKTFKLYTYASDDGLEALVLPTGSNKITFVFLPSGRYHILLNHFLFINICKLHICIPTTMVHISIHSHIHQSCGSLRRSTGASWIQCENHLLVCFSIFHCFIIYEYNNKK